MVRSSHTPFAWRNAPILGLGFAALALDLHVGIRELVAPECLPGRWLAQSEARVLNSEFCEC